MGKGILTTTGLAVALALFLAVNILAGIALRSARIDLTQSGLYTLSQGTRNVLADLGEDVTLRFYFSRKIAQEHPGVKAYAMRVQELLEEYAAASPRLTLIVADPEPFSEEEDRAVSFGLQGAPATRAGDLLYFGLVGTNTTDDVETIPFFHESREEFLEYDVTRLVYKLAHPKRPVVGLITQLPLRGGPPANPFVQQGRSEPWVVAEQIEQLFELRSVPWTTGAIEADVDVLMIVHPKDLPEQTLYAIDQFVLRGGRALVFVDPFCEADQPPRDPQNPMASMGAKRSSDLAPLLATWGVAFKTDEVLGDRERALGVLAQGQPVDYVVWVGQRRDKDDFSTTDAVTSELNLIHLACAGTLSRADGSQLEFSPLLSSSEDSMHIPAATLAFQQMMPDPAGLLDSFVPEGKRFAVAARVSGQARSAFPDGDPTPEEEPEDAAEEDGAEGDAQEDAQAGADASAKADHLTEGTINVVVVADADILGDRLWVRVQNFLGTRLVSPMADNGNLVINALENLSGSNDLISLRSRGRFNRPFDRVIDLRREAEARFRQKEKELEDRLRETETRLTELQTGKEGVEQMILSPEQKEEITRFQEERVRIRKDLREVKRQLNRDIENLGTGLKLANVLGIPAAVALFGVASFLARTRRRTSAGGQGS